jgi:hypothetical protein
VKIRPHTNIVRVEHLIDEDSPSLTLCGRVRLRDALPMRVVPPPPLRCNACEVQAAEMREAVKRMEAILDSRPSHGDPTRGERGADVEMDEHLVQVGDFDDSREAIYGERGADVAEERDTFNGEAGLSTGEVPGAE